MHSKKDKGGMSEKNRQLLIETLSALDNEDKAWVINFLVNSLAGLSVMPKKKARKPNRDSYTDDQWEEYFNGRVAKEISTDTMPLDKLLRETAGKAIKPIEKWL